MEKFTNYTANNNIKLLLINGATRQQNNCPGQESKTTYFIKSAIRQLSSNIEVDYLDLTIGEKSLIQPCKGCISTAGGAQCSYPCSCYAKDLETPDKMYEEDIYKRLESCDAFIIFSPIHWYSLTSQLKTMFDRLVCINQTLTVEQAMSYFATDIKNIEMTKPFTKEPFFKDLIKNHLEGKVCAFFAHGDNGADDYEGKKLPIEYTRYNPDTINNPKYGLIPFVWQMRYSGVDVPDELVEAFYLNEGMSYSDANDNLPNLDWVITKTKMFIESVSSYTSNKKFNIL